MHLGPGLQEFALAAHSPLGRRARPLGMFSRLTEELLVLSGRESDVARPHSS
jgi:hypothetical protein